MKELIELVGSDNVIVNESMAKHTTFRIGGNADLFATPAKEETLIQLIQYCQNSGVPYFILGNGSNLLISDDGIEGVVISLEKLDEVTVQGNTITAQAGAKLSRIAAAAQQHSLTGLEFAAGIPGTLGGGVFMNCGAYDGELKNVVCAVTVYTENGVQEIPCCDCGFIYRGSIFQQNQSIILKASLCLSPGDPEEIARKMKDFSERRRKKQPLEYPSAGSAFKRPTGHFAAQLIEEAGLKGHRVGGAMVSEKHSGFIINAGGATAKDVLTLIAHVKQTVRDRFGVELHEEIKMIGR